MRLPLLLLLCAAPAVAEPPPDVIALPDGAAGIGFDDLRFDPALDRLLVPAGRTGNVDLVDPATRAVTPIGGFSALPRYDAGHGQGVTSVDVGAGALYATDRTARTLVVVDAKTRRIVHRVPLAGTPDYVRFVAPTHEVWVTEPAQARIEVFRLGDGAPAHVGFIAVPGGPESLVIDATRGRAYTHRWKRETVAIDLARRAVAATWPSGCGDPRGIALDEPRALLLIGCEDGTATVLDVAHDGALRSTAHSGRGVDIIAYDPTRAHLYLPGDESATLAILGVGAGGALSLLGVAPTTADAHCVTTDERGHAYVCDPRRGRLLIVRDPYPSTR
jgi:hypothetical protein